MEHHILCKVVVRIRGEPQPRSQTVRTMEEATRLKKELQARDLLMGDAFFTQVQLGELDPERDYLAEFMKNVEQEGSS